MNDLFADVGFGNLVNVRRIVSVLRPDSAPSKRIISQAKDDSALIDATQGRRTQSILITDAKLVILSYLSVETISERFSAQEVSQ